MASKASTPAFAWALPKVKTSPHNKPAQQTIQNPLLKRTSPNHSLTQFSNVQPSGNSILAPNTGGIRRRKAESSRSKTDGLPSSSLVSDGFSRVPKSSIADEMYSRSLVVKKSPDEIENENALWVVVFGIRDFRDRDAILRRLETFGTVDTVRDGRSNWVAVKYGKRHEGEKALMNSPFLVESALFGVTRLDEGLKQSLEWTSAFAVDRKDSTQAHKSSSNQFDDGIYLDQRNLEVGGVKSICEKVLALLFGWE